MHAESSLQPLWDWILGHLGTAGVANPGFLFTAVVAGVYLPGIVFSFVDVVITRRLTARECWDVYWRAMKWYGTLYPVAMLAFFVLPISVLFTIPYAVVGSYWSLYLTHTTMDSVGWIGIIILVGVVVNNGIVLIDRVHELRRQGWERTPAVLEGCRNRVRPILMTALTSVIGLWPMAVTEPPGESIDFRALATCVGGGLTISTFFTLWVVPIAYTVLDDLATVLRGQFAWSLRRRGGALSPAAGPRAPTAEVEGA